MDQTTNTSNTDVAQNKQHTVTAAQAVKDYMPKAISEVLSKTGPATSSLMEQIINEILLDEPLFSGANPTLSQACRLLAFMNTQHSTVLKIVHEMGLPVKLASTLDEAFNAALTQLHSEQWGMDQIAAEELFNRTFSDYKPKLK